MLCYSLQCDPVQMLSLATETNIADVPATYMMYIYLLSQQSSGCLRCLRFISWHTSLFVIAPIKFYVTARALSFFGHDNYSRCTVLSCVNSHTLNFGSYIVNIPQMCFVDHHMAIHVFYTNRTMYSMYIKLSFGSRDTLSITCHETLCMVKYILIAH